MNYEKIIVELLGRIQVLEEQLAMLMQEKNQASEQEVNKITTDDIRQHILELKKAAKDAGKSFIILKSGDIHKELNLKSRMPQVCNAMRQSMNEGDIVLLIADPEKLVALPNRCLVVDSGDTELDQELCGWRAVVTGLGQTTMMKVSV